MTNRRMISRSLFFFALLLFVSACIKRQPLPSQPADSDATPTIDTSESAAAPTEPTGNFGKVEGVDVLQGQGVSAFTLQGKTAKVHLSTVKVEGEDFDEALRAHVKQPSVDVWDVQLQAKVPVAVEQGDILLATFFFRSSWSRQEGGEGQTEFVFELGQDPYPKSVTHGVRAGNEWNKIYVPFEAKQDYAAGTAQVAFRLGYPPQKIEIGGVKIENFKKDLALADLPTTVLSYKGMSDKAAWRQAAAERIEKHRKGELEVVVKSATGAPVSGAEVRVRLERHGFAFGTSAPASKVLDEQDSKFMDQVAEHFSVVTLENDLKWPALAGDWGAEYTVERAQRAAKALNERGILVRGHTLVWPSWQQSPRSLESLSGNQAKLAAAVDRHIVELTTAMKGSVAHWDVVNEPYDNHDLLDLLGQRAMVGWFEKARGADPKARLYINDYAILSGGGGKSSHRDHYAKTIKTLLDAGAPIDGIGMQGHFGTTLTPPEALLATLDRFAKLGKPIFVTAFDVSALTDEQAALYIRDFYTALFSHPAVEGIVMWGFWDGAHWKNNAPLYRQDWSIKPAGEAYRKLVLEQWHTDTTGKSSATGTFKTRGFLGEYVVQATHGGKTSEARGTLTKAGTQLVVKLK